MMLEPPLEPPDPIEISCTECGEEENIENISYDRWKCLNCNETFTSVWDEQDYER